jgi:hypothetical protein
MCRAILLGFNWVGERACYCIIMSLYVIYPTHEARTVAIGKAKSEKHGYTYEIYNWYFIFALLVLGFIVLV